MIKLTDHIENEYGPHWGLLLDRLYYSALHYRISSNAVLYYSRGMNNVKGRFDSSSMVLSASRVNVHLVL